MELIHKTFTHDDLGTLRTIFGDNMLYVSAMDLGRMLGYRDGAKAMRSHCPVIRSFAFRSESGIQHMLFLDAEQTDTILETSNSPAADKIVRWICDVIIPYYYGINDYMLDDEANPDVTDDLTSVAEDLLTTAKNLSDIVGRLLKIIDSHV